MGPEDSIALSLAGMLPVERINAKILPMLNDFLAVLRGNYKETDSSVIRRAHEKAKRFYLLLKNLGLRKAPEKDQPSGFPIIIVWDHLLPQGSYIAMKYRNENGSNYNCS